MGKILLRLSQMSLLITIVKMTMMMTSLMMRTTTLMCFPHHLSLIEEVFSILDSFCKRDRYLIAIIEDFIYFLVACVIYMVFNDGGLLNIL